MKTRSAISIACFGEILWDCLPRGVFLGGAPLNAAYHLARQGVRVFPVSAVGRDFLGDEAVRRIEEWGLDTRSIARRSDFPTGTVRAVLDQVGIPTYRIARSVAWDHIAAPAASSPSAIVFGTLALREPANRRALAQLLAKWPRALRVVDLNLRPPFDGSDAVAFALGHAQLLKLNDQELARLSGAPVSTSLALEQAARGFAGRHDLDRVCVTAGHRGAGLLWYGRWFWAKARQVKIRDTVGAGDAFLGGLLAALLARNAPPAVALASACRMGEFVAARDGATPPYRIGAGGRPLDSAR